MIKLVVLKNDCAYDMTELVFTVRWSGRKGSAARSLSVTFIDDDGYGHDRSGIDVEAGHQCIFYWKGQELFRGIFMRQEQSEKKTMTVIAYDNGIYLANNKDTFNYTDKTASFVFKDCCTRFGIPIGSTVDTRYVIPELPKPKTTGWDVICDALSITYKATGVRYYPVCRGEAISLIERRENVLQWVLETGVNLEDYSQTKSIESVKTRIKLLSKEGEVLATATDNGLEKKIGAFQDVVQINDEMTTAQLTELANTTLSESNKPARTLTVTALGLPDVLTGIGVFIQIKELYIAKTYYVEEDTHIFDGNYHSMTLKLVFAADFDKNVSGSSANAANKNGGNAGGGGNSGGSGGSGGSGSWENSATAADGTVYLAETGTKYHRYSCPTLGSVKKAMSLAEAKRTGYAACTVCRP